MSTRPRNKKPTPAEAKRDREFLQRQAFELRKMRDAQRRVKSLVKELDRVTRDADMARVDGARRLVDGTPFTIVSEEWRMSIERQAEDATERVAELQKQLEKARSFA